MDRVESKMAKRMGIGDEWKVRFDLVQDELGTRAIGMVYPSRGALQGGEIVLDSGIFRPGGQLQSLSLRSRIQAILAHEAVEGASIQALRQMGIHWQEIPERFILTMPLSHTVQRLSSRLLHKHEVTSNNGCNTARMIEESDDNSRSNNPDFGYCGATARQSWFPPAIS